MLHRDANHAAAGLREAVGAGAAPDIIDPDDGTAVLCNAIDQALLDRGVMFDRAVAIDMVLADIDQDADGGVERRTQVDISMTWTRPRRGGSSDRIAVPILPPIWVS